MRAITWSEKGEVSDVNEDACVALPSKGVFAVCDGVGGGPAGEYASRTIIEYISSQLCEVEASKDFIRESIESVNRDIHGVSRQEGFKGMASTIALAWVESDLLTCFHVGDSRIYRLRENQLSQLTEDHTALVARAKGLKSVVTRAMGIHAEIEVDVSEWHWQVGDIIMLASDGITDLLKNEEIQSILSSEEMTMVEKARKLASESSTRGSRDDKTVVIAF